MYEVEAPEGATQQDAIAYVQANAASIPKAETSVIRDVGGALVRGAGQIVSLPGQLFGLATGDMDNVSTRAGKSVEEFGEELQTAAFRERQRQQAERVAKAEEEGILSGFGQQAKELLTDPLSLAAGVAQTLPAMIGTGGAGLAGRALAGRLIGQQAVKRGALAGAAAGESAIVSGDAAQSTYDRVSQMPQEVLARSGAYQAALAEGATPEEARNTAAISAARRAAAIAAPIAAVTGPLGIEAALLTGGVRRGLVRGAGEGLVREGGTEIVQETGQGIAENIGAQAIDPNVALTEGLGGRAAAGLILGGTMGGGAGAISGLRGPEAAPGTEPPPPPPPPPPTVEPEPEPVVPATPFGVPPETDIPAGADTEDTVIIEDDQVIIESPDGSLRSVPRDEWEASQGAATPPPSGETTTATPPPSGEATTAGLTPETYVDRYVAGEGRGNTPEDLEFQQYGANFGPEIEAEFARRQGATTAASTPDAAPASAPDVEPVAAPVKIPGASESIARHEARGRRIAYMTPEEYHQATGRPSPEAQRPGITDKLVRDIAENGLQEIPWIDLSGNDGQEGRHRMDALARLGYKKIPVAIVREAPTPEGAVVAAPAPAPAKPLRTRAPRPPKAATTMQARIAQIAKTFKKGQDRYSFESAVNYGVDPDWLNSRADLRRMFGKEKLTRGPDGKVTQNRRQIDEKLKDFADLAASIQGSDWGAFGDSVDSYGRLDPEALADLINRNAPLYDPTTGAAYEQETQEDDGLEATMQSVSIEANNLGVELTDGDMRAIAEQIGYDGDPAQGIVDYVNAQFEEVMAEARDYSEYDAGQEEFPDGPVTNIEDSFAEPGVRGQAAAPGDARQGQADREQPAGTAPGTQEGSLGLEATQPTQSGMTERQRAEMQARLQQSQMRRGNQESFDQQEGGMFDASRDQGDLLSSVEPGGLVGGVRMDIDKYRNGTLPDLLEEIFANFDNKFSQYDMYLAGRISALLDEVKRAGLKVKLNIVQQGDPAPTRVAYGSSYGAVVTDLDGNTIEVYLRSPTTGENSAGNTSEIVLHEALHAVSAAFVLAAKRGRNVTPKMKKFVSDLNDLYGAFVRHFNQRVKSGAKLTEFEQSIRERRTNALVDPDEFLTWGMTNDNAQEYLRGIDVGPGQNLFQRFVMMFKALLGIPDGDTSAFSRLIEIVNPLFEATEADYRAIMGGPPSGKQGPAQGTLFARGAQTRGRAPPPPSGATPSPPQQPPSAPQPRITLPKETRPQGFARKLVDRFERLRVVQSLGQLRAGVEGFYEAARKFDSRAGELMQKFDRDYFLPIQKIMKEAGLNLATVDGYLYARAAPARNARLQAKVENEIRTKMEATEATEDEIDAAIEQAYEEGKIPTAGSGITTEQANDILNGFAGQDYSPALERIGELFNRANKERMENNIKAGLVSRAAGEKLLEEEPDYVPMKGSVVDEDLTQPAENFEDSMGYGGTGFGVSTREWYEARGRSGLPFSPLGTFISDVGTSVVRGERNRVGQKLMNFFIDNPSDSWKVFSYKNPPRDRNGNIQRPSPKDDNFMIVKRGGETFYLRINDPLLAKAAKNLNAPQMGVLLQLSNKATRLLSRSFTTANPDFFVPNIFRDLQSAAMNLAADAPGLAKAFGKNVRDKKAFRTIAAFEYGREGGDPALRKQYEQFKLDGGSVSWAQRETPQEAAAQIQKDLKTVNDSLQDLKDARTAKQAIDAVWSPTSKGFRAMVGALESTNAIFENGIRFAAYRAAIDVDMTREQAAMISREATVDFNRRGEAGAMLNALYAFFNAGIQGSVRTARALSNNPFKTGKLSSTQAALLGMIATAATLAAANASMSDEDDDGKLFWDKIPDYEKERNLIIMNPVDGKTYVKIPMPYGFGFFPYLATRTMDAARRGDDLGAAGIDIVTAALGNFSPMQFGAGNIPSSVARAATPTMLKPFVELMLNENFMGKPIYNEPFDKGQSYASVARFNTWEGYKELAQLLNDISGGEGKVKGNLNTPPESFEYLLEFSFGGVSNLAKSLYRTGTEGELGSAPVVRRLAGQPSKGRNVGEYYEREEQARVVNQQMKDLTGTERLALREKFPVETSPRIQTALTSARSAVLALNKERKRIQGLDMDEGAKAERLEVLRERIDGEFVRFNRIYNQVEQATR
jgi:hypothetical protein